MANLSETERNVQAQAKLRLIAGLPVVVSGLLAVYFLGTPFGQTGLIAVGIIAAVHVLYILAALFVAKRIGQLVSARTMVIATAILDPFMLSAWLTMTGETGALFVCFYLFTILGFGFRIGPYAMRICQAASLAGFALVLVIGPVWHLHPILGLSFFSILVVVPLYATGLINNLRIAQERAEYDSQAKSQLLAKVSHELRTPLAGIIASAELLSTETTDPHTAGRAKLILNLSSDLLLEINDLLDMAKLEAKALALELAPFDLHVLMTQVHQVLAATAAAKNIRLTVSVDPLVDKMVLGDVHYLGRVLKNLAGNAVKFTGAGEVSMTLTLLEQSDSFYRIAFSVRDTGIGIPQALHERIFEPFFQASAGTARQYGGTGLGMSLARDVVRLMGSDIAVQSEVGTGSQFSFDVRMPTIVSDSKQAVVKSLPPVVYGKRILVADDNMTNLHLIRELLTRDRHHVVIATDGEQALDRLATEIFDVVFLDYHMGDMDGGQVLQLYQFGSIDRAPVCFLTADTTPATTATLLAMGAAGILNKPITGIALRRAITELCDPGASPAMPESVLPDTAAPAVVVATQAALPPTQGLVAALVPEAPHYLDLTVIDELRSLSARPDFLAQIVKSAIGDIERNGRALRSALAANDVTSVKNAAHALRGICVSIGAARLAATSGRLMLIDRDALLHTRSEWEQELTDLSQQTLAALRTLHAQEAD